jgi:hypothetical protein
MSSSWRPVSPLRRLRAATAGGRTDSQRTNRSGKSLANGGCRPPGIQQAGQVPRLNCWFGMEPPAGIEPATPSLPSMRRWFTPPRSTSPSFATTQVCMVVYGTNTGAIVPAALDHKRQAPPVHCSPRKWFGVRVERAAKLHPLCRRAAEGQAFASWVAVDAVGRTDMGWVLQGWRCDRVAGEARAWRMLMLPSAEEVPHATCQPGASHQCPSGPVRPHQRSPLE